MNDRLFEVIKPGLLTTVQDLGRTGFQQYGVVVSGAMDAFAFQVANVLVGNRRHEACLEIAHIGPELRILQDTVLVICGADLSACIDGTEITLWKTFVVKKGQILSFAQPKDGAYAYIAVPNGIHVPIVMGSKSTYVKGTLGGYRGRPLRTGDILNGGLMEVPFKKLSGRGLSSQYIADYKQKRTIRVILGPDDRAFTEKSIQILLNQPFIISPQSDRMGYQLTGPILEHKDSADIISDAILPGTIQVPASGKPIILLADRQTTGGYTRIATVIFVDLPYIAQALPNDSITFKAVTTEKAQALFIRQEKLLRQISIMTRVL